MRLVSVVVVACLLVLARPADAADAKSIYPLLGADAQFVAAFDLVAVRDAPSFDAILGASGASAKLDELTANTGVDFRKDVDTVLMGGIKDAPVMVVIGRFTAAQKKSMVAKATAKKHRGVTYWVHGDGEMAWLGKQLVFTSPGGMTAVIDRFKKKAPSMARAAGAADLREAVAMTNTRNHVWFAMTTEMVGSQGLPTSDLDLVTLGASLGADVALDVRARAVSADAAAKLETMVTASLPQLQDAMKQMGFAGAAGSIAVGHDDRILELTATIPGDELTMLLTFLK